VTVDAERLLSAYLRAWPAVTAIVGDRVYTDLPSRATFPLIRLTQLGGRPLYSNPLYIDEAFIQIDAYGGPKVIARQIVDVVREALVTSQFITKHDTGTVSNVVFGELAYIPDDTYDPAKPRYTAEVSILTHP
jgi:hypothetical protein